MGKQRRSFTPDFSRKPWTCAGAVGRVRVRWRESAGNFTQVARVAGAERMDLFYSEGGGEFHSGVRVFPKHLA